MTPEAKKRIQLFLYAAIAIAALRTGWIFYQRHSEDTSATKREAPPLKSDYYVTPKKLYPYDLKSAKQLTKQPVWVREGYRFSYYPFNPAIHRSDFAHEMGTLGPIEKLDIKDVVMDITPGAPNQRQVMAIFQKDLKFYAFPIGSLSDGNYKIYSDEMLYIQDPHQLYSHWPADVWAAIDKHEVKPGMNQLQALFAIGAGTPDDMHDADNRTVNYPNGGKPVIVTFRNDKAVEVKAGS
ncbi:MAG TPA: hypothetical protein VGF06_02570 [Terriglobales bacterium]|jgi:hypothetical protein